MMNKKMLEYIDEIRNKYRADIIFKERQLPSIPEAMRTVTIPRELFLRTRIEYEILIDILSDILGVEKEKLCLLGQSKRFKM